MALPEIEVLVRHSGPQESEQSASLQRLPVRIGETVAGLKALGLLSEGVKLGPDGGATLFSNGVELADASTLDQCGVHAATGEESWAPDFIYPNGWQQMSHRKATAKARGVPDQWSRISGSKYGWGSLGMLRMQKWTLNRLFSPWLMLIGMILLANLA
ncbi:hypothetical protein KFL_002260090 [Klebsormidium nitens]|uniref:Uncharacterized protein n=1 Tax=Klebsormidium nitens TaxID=105231 RepID=A0A1Y1I438_KLENI|nr:hypothetical protein KFL_002260090 [Klebsormidium nitens]|eukprot:GAQ85253.1 hypothetical protein KFL_002260090 [Klebsormidium nitens]